MITLTFTQPDHLAAAGLAAGRSLGSIAIGVALLALGIALLFADVLWRMYQARNEPVGADESYADELHAAAELEPDPTGWSALHGFDYRVVFERIADGYGAAVSPPPVLFDTLAAQLPQPDPTWLTFDTSAWRTVRASADELAREYPGHSAGWPTPTEPTLVAGDTPTRLLSLERV